MRNEKIEYGEEQSISGNRHGGNMAGAKDAERASACEAVIDRNITLGHSMLLMEGVDPRGRYECAG